MPGAKKLPDEQLNKVSNARLIFNEDNSTQADMATKLNGARGDPAPPRHRP